MDYNKIVIFNASHVTKELPIPILNCLSQITTKQIVISLSPNFTEENTLFLIICPAGWKPEISLPKNYITYQLEINPYEFDQRRPYISYLQILKSAIFNWDYSLKNCLRFPEFNLKYVVPGYDSYLTNKINVPYTDKCKIYDVLFLGWDIYPRRQFLKKELEKRGLKVLFVCDLDLRSMQHHIRISKIQLNFHFSDTTDVLETIRLNILLSNSSCVVSETTNDEIQNEYKDYVSFVPFEELANKCVELIKNNSERERMANESFQWYSTKRIWKEIVDFKQMLP